MTPGCGRYGSLRPDKTTNDQRFFIDRGRGIAIESACDENFQKENVAGARIRVSWQRDACERGSPE